MAFNFVMLRATFDGTDCNSKLSLSRLLQTAISRSKVHRLIQLLTSKQIKYGRRNRCDKIDCQVYFHFDAISDIIAKRLQKSLELR